MLSFLKAHFKEKQLLLKKHSFAETAKSDDTKHCSIKAITDIIRGQPLKQDYIPTCH